MVNDLIRSDILHIIKNNRSNYSLIIKHKQPEIYHEIIGLKFPTFSEKLYNFLYNTRRMCIECGNLTTFISIFAGYAEFCSNKCVNKSSTIRTRIKAAYKDKYGVDNISQLDSIKNRKRQTTLKNYNVDCPFQIPLVKELAKEKTKEYIDKNRYQILSNLNLRRKHLFIDNCLSGLRFDNILTPLFNFDNFTNIGDNNLRFKCNVCGVEFCHHLKWGTVPICKNCNPTSRFEQSIYDFLILECKIDRFDIIRNIINIIPYKELDIYIPRLKLAIECNGIYWHSIDRKYKNYHLNKTKACEKRNIKLVHIFEDEWKSLEFREFLRQLLLNKELSASNFCVFDLGITKLNRRIYNKCFIPEDYMIEMETSPTVLSSNVWDCGWLWIRQKFEL